MINSKQCYRDIGTSILLSEYFESNINNFLFEHYYGFQVSEISSDIFLKEPILYSVNEKHKIKKALILKFEPNICYNWHKDSFRGVAINMILTPQANSFVLFGNSSPHSEDEIEILKFEYEPKTFYLFNAQLMHMVINFESPRFLFTVEFEETKETLNYNNLLL